MADDKEMVTEALAKELGIEVGDSPNAEADDFFAEVERSRQPQEEPEAVEEEPQKWVHEPTGKEFDSEVEYLRHDSGFNNDKWGKRFQELEERIAKATSRENSAEKPNNEANPLTKEELKKKLWPNQKDEYREDPVADFVLEGLDNALSIALGPLQQQLQKSQETVQRLESQLQETGLRSEYGVDAKTEQKLIEKHEWLASIPDAKSRMAAMKHLLAQTETGETPKKLADKLPQRSAADHVENSAGGAMPENEGFAEFESKLMASDDKQRLSVFGKLFEDSELGRRLTGLD
jgi:hypothetical protein